MFQKGFNHSRKDQREIAKFDECLSSRLGNTTASTPSFRASSSKTYNEQSLGRHNVVSHFPKDPNCEVCRRTNVTKEPCRILTIEQTDFLIAERFDDLITGDHKVLNEDQESRMHHKYGCGRLGDSVDSKLSMQNQVRRR